MKIFTKGIFSIGSLTSVLFLLMGQIAVGQITDDFTDGDFTANPVWSGNTSDFSILTAAALPSGTASTDASYLGSNASTGNVTLTTPSTEVSEWKFSLGSPTFNPASGNYFGVILMSSVAVSGSITATSWNGYYLKIGIDGSTDPIELWRKSGTGVGTKVGDFPSSPNYGTNALAAGVNIRVTRNASGVFQLYYSTGFTYGSTPTTSAGTLTDNTVTTSSYFGIYSVFSSAGASRRVYIDNIVIGVASASPPVVTGGTVTGTVGTALSPNYQISASNSPTSYAIASGTIPAGLSFSTSTGIISGTPTAAGTSAITVTATNAAGTSSSAATINFNIAKANQTITFATLSNKQYGDANFNLTGTTTSPLTVAYESSNTAVATVLGNVVTIVGVGSTNITASQAGDVNYNPAANVIRQLTVTAKTVTIGGLTGDNKTYDATTTATVSGTATLNGVLVADELNVSLTGTASYTFATATVGSAKPISVSGLSLTGSKAGNYILAALTGVSANITEKAITVTGVTAQDKSYDGTTTATISGGTLSGVETADTVNVSVSTTGTFASANVGAAIAVTVSLTGSASGNYSFTQPGITANITKANQTITFNTLPALNTGSAPVNLNTYASTTSGLALTYVSSNPLVVSVSGNTLTVVGVGTATITASQAGDSNYNVATNATQSVTVLLAPSLLAQWILISDVLPSSVATNVTASNFTKTANLGLGTSTFGPSASGYFADSWPTANAIDLTKYFEISVNPNANYDLLIDELQFGERRSNTGIRTYQVRYSLDDFTTSTTIATVGVPDNDLERTGNIGSLNIAVEEGKTLKFRFYAYGAESANGTWRINDATLKINGYVVPVTPPAVTWDGDSWSNSDGPTASIDAIIDGDYSTQLSGGFTAKNLTLTSGSVTVDNDTNITVVGDIINNLTAADFVVENNANLLQSGTTNNNSGDITVLRNSSALKRLDYTLWSSPVAGQGLYAFSPFTFANRFYTYTSSGDIYTAIPNFDIIGLNTDQVNGIDTNNVQFETATGYLIRMPWNHPTTATPWNGTFKGLPNNGDVTVEDLTTGLYYAVGNPYPSTINADAFIDANDLTDALYFWRKTNLAAGSAYATYTLAGGTTPSPGTGAGPGDPNSTIPNGTIQVGQGFIAKATSSTLSFTNLMRVANNEGQFFKDATTVERSRIWLNLTNNSGLNSQTMVAYMTNATSGIDAAIDGKYINDSQTALTSVINGEEFAVQGRALPFVNSDIVPLGFKTETAGNYTISLYAVDGLFTGGAQAIYLKDNLTSTIHDFNTGAYTFASATGTFNNRFQIVYQPQLANPIFTANTVLIYSQDNGFVVNSGNFVMSSIKVFDIRGRLIEEKKAINANQAMISGGSSNGVLLVQITTEDGVTVTKKVIR